MQELQDETQAEENKKKKKQKKKVKHKVDVDGAGAAGGAAAGYAGGDDMREEAGATALDDGTANARGESDEKEEGMSSGRETGMGDAGGGLWSGPVEAEDAGGWKSMRTQQGRAKTSGQGRSGGGQGAAMVSVAGDLTEGGAAKHAVVALGVEMAELSLAPGAGNVAAQGIREAESLFLAKFKLMDDNAPSAPATTDARGQHAGGEGIDGVDGGGSVGLGGGGGAAGATEVADTCEKVKAVVEYKARAAAAELKLAESTECSVCMGHKNHVLIPCGHVCVCEQCAANIMASSKQCPVCRSTVAHICKVYF